MEAEAAIENGEEIADGGLFDEGRCDRAAVAAAPDLADGEAGPFDGWAVLGQEVVGEARGEGGGFAGPIAEVIGGDAGKQRVAGDSGEAFEKRAIILEEFRITIPRSDYFILSSTSPPPGG